MKKIARKKAIMKAALKRAAIITAKVNAPYMHQWATMEVYRHEGKKRFLLVAAGEKNWNGTITWNFNMYRLFGNKRIPYADFDRNWCIFWGFTTEEHYDMYTNIIGKGFEEAAKIFGLNDPIFHWKYIDKKIEIDF